MGGALIQLVAYGIQDLYLTSDPQITYFKIIYRRHTNFSIESVLQPFSSPANFNEKVTCTLSRSGDLVEQIYLYVGLPPVYKFIDCDGQEDLIKKFAWVESVGYAMIKEVTIEIGGKKIDRQYGEFLYLWEQLSGRQPLGINKMVGNVPELTSFTNGKNAYQLFIPLKFWFCKNNGLSLPIIALASTDVKITVIFRRFEECSRIGPTFSIEILEDVCPFNPGDYIEQIDSVGNIIYGYFMDYDYITKRISYIKIVADCAINKRFCSQEFCDKKLNCRIYSSLNKKLFCMPVPGCAEQIENTCINAPSFINSFLYVNYIYLDTDERLKFGRSNHEYLIDQVQINETIGIKSPNVKQNLNLNHPCKEHIWIAQLDMLVGPNTINDIFNYTDSPIRYPDGRFYGKDLVRSATLVLNGQNRFETRESEYFNHIVPMQCHYRGPPKGINVYSFSLYPEDHQPSSTCNMSRIDYIVMLMHLSKTICILNTCKIRSYTTNYNILRIFFNLGGLAFE